MTLARYKPPKHNIRESAWWRSERHRKFVRGFVCVVPGCMADRRECCHIRTGTDGAMGEKPSDFWCFPACVEHHRQQHDIGEPAFERMHGIDLKCIAEGLARQSVCRREIEEWKRTHARAA